MPQNYYNQIKTELINNEAYKRVKDYSKNRSDLATYYNVGKILVAAQGGEKRAKYGDELIKNYSKRLVEEVGKQYNWITLTKMRKFYLMTQKVATVSQQLTWSHYVELLKFNDINEINTYLLHPRAVFHQNLIPPRLIQIKTLSSGGCNLDSSDLYLQLR